MFKYIALFFTGIIASLIIHRLCKTLDFNKNEDEDNFIWEDDYNYETWADY